VWRLDEPAGARARRLASSIFRTVQRLPELGTAVLLVEENARMALEVADRGYVIETGRIVLEGTAAELKAHPGVQEAYLGRLRSATSPPGPAEQPETDPSRGGNRP
jgi:branched-chain amino acid transport system ATP-binding protein